MECATKKSRDILNIHVCLTYSSIALHRSPPSLPASRPRRECTTHGSPPFTEGFHRRAHFSAVFTASNGTLSTFFSFSSLLALFFPSAPREGKSFALDFSSNVTRARSKLAPPAVCRRRRINEKSGWIPIKTNREEVTTSFCSSSAVSCLFDLSRGDVAVKSKTKISVGIALPDPDLFTVQRN